MHNSSFLAGKRHFYEMALSLEGVGCPKTHQHQCSEII
jgi:hypothetical protein